MRRRRWQRVGCVLPPGRRSERRGRRGTRARRLEPPATAQAIHSNPRRYAHTRARCEITFCPRSAVRLSAVHRSDLQALADGLLADGLSPSAVQVAMNPLRAIFRHAIERDELAVNPCSGLRLPAVRSRRERFVSVVEAEALIMAVPEGERTIWATAMYAGLRLGELRALRVGDLDLAVGVIRVERGWDPAAGPIELKSRAGRRRVSIIPALRDHLTEHVARERCAGDDLIFGRTAAEPFTANGVQRRADAAWKDAKLARVTPHELRHLFASLMIAAGVNSKALQMFMGHATISVTLDQYGHLLPAARPRPPDSPTPT